ncbi:MAG: MGH1-like glycoside hydrolase domain-containing protein [Spirochaetaceae bacterium]
MVKKGFPAVHFYDQDFVDLYEQTWAWIQDAWYKNREQSSNGFAAYFLLHPEGEVIGQFEACLSSFFLAYSNKIFPGYPNLDNFYSKQEDSGAIRGTYRVVDGAPVFTDDNPEGVGPPLFAYAEYNLFHKGGNKKRLKEVVPVLEAYFSWLEETFKRENGLYAVPLEATRMDNAPREEAYYPLDFNIQQAINALYMSALGDILNDKELSFTYKRHYFSLKTRINSLMWDKESEFYYDLDRKEEHVKVKTIAGFWALLAEIPNEAKASSLIDHLKNPETFGVEHPFPTLAADEPQFDENGAGCRGAVYPPFNFMIIKGLEKYARYELAREVSIRHLYYVLDTLHPEGREEGNIWEAYKPTREGPAYWEGNEDFPKPRYLEYVGLSTITLMIENVLGLFISLPRKTVDWIMPNLEIMGIENLSLKRNIISILTNKSNRGWEVRLESEKLYYFTINILEEHKKKTLPIPSGKCSMLIEKM